MQFPITIKLSERREEIYTKEVTFREKQLNTYPSLKQLLFNKFWVPFVENINDFKFESRSTEDSCIAVEVTDSKNIMSDSFCY